MNNLFYVAFTILFFLLATGFTGYLLRLKYREKEALNYRISEIYAWVLLMLPWCVAAMNLVLEPTRTQETPELLNLFAMVIYAQTCSVVIHWVLRRPTETGSFSLLRSIWSTFLACIIGVFCLLFYWMVVSLLATFLLGIWKMLR